HALDLLQVLRAGEEAAQLRKAEVDQPGVEHVGLAVAANPLEVAALPGLPDLTALEAELARKPEQARRVGERHAAAPLEARQHVHEIGVPPVIAAQLVVVAGGRILRAALPEARRLHPPEERPVGEHRQIERRAVPGHEVGGEFLDAVEEALHQLPFPRAGLAETPELQALLGAQRTGDRNHPVLLERQEVPARVLAAQRILGGEARAPEGLAALSARELRLRLGHEQMLEEASAETLKRARDAPALEDIDADAEDHARAATIRAFISRTAAARPTNSACPI